MHNFKKAVCSAVVTVLTFILISTIVITPYLNSEKAYYQDNRLRGDLAGTIDCIVLGSSHGLAAFDTRVLDEELGCCSYNLSTVRMTLDNKYFILEKELKRNPADIVILEVAYDTLVRVESEEFSEGDVIAITRMDNTLERLTYMTKYVKLDGWLNMYSRLFVSGLSYCMDVLQGNTHSKVDAGNKGFLYQTPTDLTSSEEQTRESYNYKEVSTDYPKENVEKFDKLVELCNAHGSRLIIAVAPVSDAAIWKIDGWTNFHKWMLEYCSDHGCEFYDLNMLADRYYLFNDRISFHDDTHMSGIGANACTEALCEIINRVDAGEDVSSLFYASYQQMKQDSPYALP